MKICSEYSSMCFKQFWLLKESAVKFTAKCKLFMVIIVLAWILCIARLKKCENDELRRIDLCDKAWSGWPVKPIWDMRRTGEGQSADQRK